MEFTDTSEKGFQRFITAYLTDKTIGHGFTESTPHEFDRDFCVNSKQLLSFIEATQKDAYEMIQRKGCRRVARFAARSEFAAMDVGVAGDAGRRQPSEVNRIERGLPHLRRQRSGAGRAGDS